MSSIVTTIGTNKLANATPLDQLEIIQIAVGDANGSTPTLNPSQTQLVNEVWRGGVSAPIKGPQENIVIFEGFIPQNIGPFTIREVGIFDAAGDLIAVGTTAIVEKPDPATETAITLRIRLHVALESTSDIQLIAQDQGVFDHQGATNRSAASAHPASSIDVDALTGLGEPAANLQTTLSKLKTAAKRDVGTATDEVSDNAQLNTRLGTTGNLGTAAQQNIGTGTDQVPDKEILDTRLATTGNLGDAAQRDMGTGTTQVSDNAQLNTRLGTTGNLGTAAQQNIGTGTDQVPDKEILDTRLGTTGNLGTAAQQNIGIGTDQVPDKEILDTRLGTTGNLGTAALLTSQTSTSDSTAGRAAIVGAFGVGGNAISVSNFDNITVGGLYYNGAGGQAPNFPEDGFVYVWHMQTAAPTADAQIAVSQSSGNIYHRVRSGSSSWQDWRGDDAGKIEYFATTVSPPGYVKANGAAISRSAYSRLFAKVGTFWGGGDGSTTFNVPDLRGEFIRAWDDGRGVDSGRSFGSFQDHEYESHSHKMPEGGADYAVYGTTTDSNLLVEDFSSSITTTTRSLTSSEGGNETRPRNIALIAYIKY